jgi:hypothetical protein
MVQARGLPASALLRRHWRTASDAVVAEALHSARASVAAFAEATTECGSLLQAWIGGQPVVEFDHYPANDVIDERSGSQFYYHAHRHGNQEHGHLHLFWHATATGRRRRLPMGDARWTRTAPTHLFAISLDARGLPVALFMVNRWVTDGHWFDAATTLQCVDRFRPGAVAGHEISCRWLDGFVRMYRPVVAELLRRRDRRLQRCKDPVHALDYHRIELLSALAIDWSSDLDAIEAEAARRHPHFPRT